MESATLYLRGRHLIQRSSAALREIWADVGSWAKAGLVSRFHHDNQIPMTTDPITLSRRERQVAYATSQGRTEAEIAERLNLSIGTVRSHRDSLRSKLRAPSLAAAIELMWELGLLDERKAASAREVWAETGEQTPWVVSLAARELEVADALAAGLRESEIAEQLHVGRETVKTHRKRLLRKLGAHTSPAAVHRLWELGLRRHEAAYSRFPVVAFTAGGEPSR